MAAMEALMQRLQCDEETAGKLLQDLEHSRVDSLRAKRRSARTGDGQLDFSADGQPRWMEGRRGKCAALPLTDDLQDRYNCFADDTTVATKKREAAMLFAVAEGHLSNDENYWDAQKSASEALSLYRGLGDATAEVDCLRLVIHASRQKAEYARWATEMAGESVAEEALAEATKLAEEQLARFRDQKEQRGQAAMLLSLAELALDGRKPRAEVQEALQNATQARELFRLLEDVKMEANAALVVARAMSRRHQHSEAAQVAEEAVQLFAQAGDKRGQGKALYVLALTHGQNHEAEEALEFAKDALVVFEQLDLKKLMASVLNTIALLHLERDKPRQALPHALEAMRTFHDLSCGKGWEATAEQTVVEAYLAKEDNEKALEVARAGVERAQDARDRREEVFAQTTLAHAALSSNLPEEAVKAATEALECCQELGDKLWEGMALLTMSQVYRDKEDFQEGLARAQEASALFEEDGDVHHEAVAAVILSSVLLLSGEHEDGLEAAKKGRELFADEEERDQEEIALIMVANAHALSEDFDEALAAAQECQQLASGSGHTRGEANALYTLAELHRQTEDYDAALEAARSRRKVCHDAGHYKAESYALHQLASIHIAMKQHQEAKNAIRAAEAAHKICRRENDKRATVHMLLMVADAHLYHVVSMSDSLEAEAKVQKAVQESAPKCTEAALEAMAVAEQVGLADLQSYAALMNAQVQLTVGLPSEAMHAANKAKALLEQTGNLQGLAQATLFAAHAKYHLEMVEAARSLAEEAMDLFRQCRSERGMAEAKALLDKMGVGRRMMQVDYALADGGAADAQPSMAAPARGVSVAEPEKPKGLDAEMVMATVQELAKAAIGLDDEVYLDSPLMDSGMDSLTAVAFRNSLQQNLAVKLPSSLMFDYPTMKDVATRIVELSLEDA